MRVIKLPKMTEFTSKTKNCSPLEKFHVWAVKEIWKRDEITDILFDSEGFAGLPKHLTIDITRIGLCEEDYKKLHKKLKSWAYQYSELSYMYKGLKEGIFNKRILEKLDFSIGMLSLSYSPREYHKDKRSKDIVPGYAYIEDDFIKNRETSK